MPLSIFSKDLTINKLLKNLDYNRVYRSRHLKVLSVKKFEFVTEPTGFIRSFLARYFNMKVIKTLYRYKVKNNVNKKVRDVFIEVFNDNEIASFDSKVNIYDSCEDFQYRMAYRCRMRKCLVEHPQIITRLGKAYTDPPKRPILLQTLICKHIYKVLEDLKRTRKWELRLRRKRHEVDIFE